MVGAEVLNYFRGESLASSTWFEGRVYKEVHYRAAGEMDIDGVEERNVMPIRRRCQIMSRNWLRNLRFLHIIVRPTLALAGQNGESCLDYTCTANQLHPLWRIKR